MLAFNHRMAQAIDEGRDVRDVEEFMDPDPLRYMWVDEGKGRIADVLEKAGLVLDQAVQPPGHERADVRRAEGSERAARPSVATAPDGTVLTVWIEWVPEQGDIVRAAFTRPDAHADADAASDSTAEAEVEPAKISGEIADVYRPTALLAADGTAWVFFGKRVDKVVSVWATSNPGSDDSTWTTPEIISTSKAPSFNQEAVAHADSRVEVVWQGRHDTGFAIYSRIFADGTWADATLVSAGVEHNVWDPSVVGFNDGAAAYAWSEYAEGRYRVVLRNRDADGSLGDPRDLTSGTDYALHPHLAVTRDQRLWCAFDLITVVGHGGSGPTKLRATEDLGTDPSVIEGMRPGSENVPPELLPDVSASIRVVNITETSILEPPGELAPRLDVVPAGLPKLVATDDGGLVVAYRIHRKLPLMTYYWEVAAQVLAPGGWLPPTTFTGTDGTLEEVAVAATSTGALVVAQSDSRLAAALDWTEGFGGRECPYLHDHHGSVVWHGVHGVGTVITGTMTSQGEAALLDEADARVDRVASGDRADARRWQVDAAERRERYAADAAGRNYQVYWGDLHRHSLVSRCTAGDEPSLDDFYRYAWDVCEYDFWAVTDHSENSTDYQWWTIQKMADLFLVEDRFVPFYGFEWTSVNTGHQNVIYGDVERGAPIYSAFAEGTTDPAGLWESLSEHPELPAITIPHHPGSAMVYNDWDYNDPRYSRLVEIFQACRGNYEADGSFRQYSDGTQLGTFTLDGLMRGHKFGFIASSDHGHGASYVGAYAEGLDRASVFEALQARRTFAATTRDIVVDVRLGEAMMGEEVSVSGPREFTIHAEGYADLARVDVVRNGLVVHSTEPGHAVPQGQVSVPVRVEWGGADATTAWDGTLTISGGEIVQTPFWSPEVIAATPQEIGWANTTTSFGEPYGSQRGCVELSLVGPPEAEVTVSIVGLEHRTTLGDLAQGPDDDLGAENGHVRLTRNIGGLSSLGVRSLDVTWTDDAADSDGSIGTAFYYVRVFQVDGEMAWSSPIWVNG